MRRDVDQPQESSKTGLSAPQANSATQRSALDALAERVGLSSAPVDAASLASDCGDSFSFSFPKGNLAGDEASFSSTFVYPAALPGAKEFQTLANPSAGASHRGDLAGLQFHLEPAADLAHVPSFDAGDLF